MTVHSRNLNFINLHWLEIGGKFIDPLAVVVPKRDTFWQLEDSEYTIFKVVPFVSLQITGVFLEPQVTDIQ